MPITAQTSAPTLAPDASGKQHFRTAFILVTALFFMWGLSYGLLDVLNKHFQESLQISRARSALLQAAYFGAYFLMAMPAAALMSRRGYKTGILLGLGLFAMGALLFIPATSSVMFEAYLLALFVIACGLACLETAANPYVTVLGSPDTSERRLNLSQSFNGLGSFIAPMIGGAMFFGSDGEAASSYGVQATYVAIAAVVAVLAILIARTPMPDIRETDDDASAGPSPPLLSQTHFLAAVVAQFFYVAAQVGIGAFFINYVTEYSAGIESRAASFLLSLAFGCFLAGRFLGTALMGKIAPAHLLAGYAMVNVVLSLVVMAGLGNVSIAALVAMFFFMSIMFPTIFALGVKGLGANTKRGASFIIMAIVGGAIVPWFMGRIADQSGTAMSFLIPAACFAIVAWYGGFGYRKA